MATKVDLKEHKFNVNEFFYSIQGEGTRIGRPCIFVRFQGCLLRCTWCDTPYALERKETAMLMSADEIFDYIARWNCKHLMLTGGEPLEQKGIFEFIALACDRGYEVVIETNGQVYAEAVDSRAVRVMDMKAPGSKMEKKNNYKNLEILTKKDELKFVIADRLDFDWSVELCNKFGMWDKVEAVVFSPVFGKLEPIELANWILEFNLKARMQVQLHKYIWEPSKRGV